MSIQPGVGFNFKQSSYGTTLDIEQGWTNLTNSQPQITPGGGGEVFVEDGETTGTVNVMVAKMRVLIQDRWEGTGYDLTTAEYAIKGIYAYPTGSKIAGTDATSVFCDDGSKYTLANAANGGSDVWYVCLIRQPMNKSGELVGPQLAIMSQGSDAYDKTTPWGEADTTDCIRLLNIATTNELDVDGTTYNFITNIAATPTQYNYNCQRVIVATLTFSGSTVVLNQHLTGTITLPNVVQFFGTQSIPVGDPSPPTAWPQYSSESDDWNGTWTGYTKASTFVSDPISPPGFPA